MKNTSSSFPLCAFTFSYSSKQLMRDWIGLAKKLPQVFPSDLMEKNLNKLFGQAYICLERLKGANLLKTSLFCA